MFFLGNGYQTRVSLSFLAVFFSLILVGVLKAESRSAFSFAFGSCNQSFDREIWQTIRAHNPEFMLLLGDNVYLNRRDFQTNKGVEQKYQDLYGRKLIKRFRSEIPIYAILDDNDTGSNDSDSSNPYLPQAKAYLRKYFPNPGDSKSLSDSIAFSFEHKGALFLLTDNRSFRVNPGYQHSQIYGDKQIDWIEETIKASKAGLIVFVSGGQFLTSDLRYEATRQYAKDFGRLLRIFSKLDKPLLILSGDRHFAEILELKINGRLIREVTASPISSHLAPNKIMQAEALRLGVSNQSRNFGLVTISPGKSKLTYNVKILTPKSEVLLETAG